MSEPGIILEYQGPVDLSVMESLLLQLKMKTEYKDLNITIRKRVYGVLVECLENIIYYSVTIPSNNKMCHPHVSIRKNGNKITIMSGNPINYEDKDKLINRLNKIKQADNTTLKELYENTINSDLKKVKNGAGLGLIYMALKSGNRISYNITPVTDESLYFEIKIDLNKYIMRKLIIDQTNNSPMVILDPENKIYQISGESRPPDVREFYDQVISWLDDFSIYLAKSDETKEPVVFNFNFEYFNSSSGKLILDICKILGGLRARGFNVTVNWHFEKEDVDMLEVGKEMSKIVKFPFEFVESAAN
jgi:hypothetical protein